MTPSEKALQWSNRYIDVLDKLSTMLEKERQEHLANIDDGIAFRQIQYTEALPLGLADLGVAIKKLLDGNLQIDNRGEIALITTVGADLLHQVRDIFASESPDGHPDNEAHAISIRNTTLVSDMKDELEKVSRQLTQDLDAIRDIDRPLHKVDPII